MQHLTDHSLLLFAAPISSIVSNHHNKTAMVFRKKKYTHQYTNKISGMSVQARSVNMNATDGVFLSFNIVQQIMTELSSAATEREKIAVITKAVFRLLKVSSNDSSYASENHSIGRQAYEVRKELQYLKSRLGPVLRDMPETSHEVLHSKLYLTD
jgi:hypothetical protein